MHDDCKQFVQTIGVLSVVDSIEKSQFKGEGDAIREFNVLADVFLVFKSLEMKRQNVRQLLDLHPAIDQLHKQTPDAENETSGIPLLRLLEVTARVTEEFVLLTQHLARAELP